MARGPGHLRIKHFNHPLLPSQGYWLTGVLFHFQARQTHFIKPNEPSTGSFCISTYKLPPQQRGEGKEPEPAAASLQLPGAAQRRGERAAASPQSPVFLLKGASGTRSHEAAKGCRARASDPLAMRKAARRLLGAGGCFQRRWHGNAGGRWHSLAAPAAPAGTPRTERAVLGPGWAQDRARQLGSFSVIQEELGCKPHPALLQAAHSSDTR